MKSVSVRKMTDIFYLSFLCGMALDIPRFYMPELDSRPVQTLRGDEAMHAIKVLRSRVGDPIGLVNGKGLFVQGEILSVDKRSLDFKLMHSDLKEGPESDFHLILAPTKSMDRLEWCLEKCTELGLSRLTLVISEHSERKKLRLDRLQRIALAAMKQSRSYFLPLIEGPQKFEDFIANTDMDQVMIAHCGEGERSAFTSEMNTVMIGPEGDFSKQEVEMAIEQGAKPVHLGPKRLRTETAALAACVISNL
ncbi:MAG: 16S rRNA (uracil(1498)-N(3))-methyltransferase [Flavobacteriales bacterium]|nr:16S rRNA (uracil(1498)-N(3))-methyltransferase [Flavobacteriales bacterium]